MNNFSIVKLKIDNNMLVATISDGRDFSIPIALFPRLKGASSDKLNNFRIFSSGEGIHWPDLDEDISIR